MKKKILHILHSEIGGTSDVVFSILRLNKNLFSEKLLFTGPTFNKAFNVILKKKKINYYYIKIFKYFYFFSFFKILFYLIKKNPSTILIHNYQILSTIIYKIFFKKKIIYIDHKAQNLKDFRDKISLFAMNFFSDRIIFVNKNNYFFYKNKNSLFSHKYRFIPNPVSKYFFFKKKFYKKKKFFNIGMASRINELKLHELIIRSIKSISVNRINIKCFFAGEGPLNKKLIKLVNKLKLQKKIIFLGNLNKYKLKNFYKKIHLYVHASKGEAMSVAILQALAMEVPVIASNVEGINNFIGSKSFLGKLFKNNITDVCNKIIYFYSLNNDTIRKYIKVQKQYVKINHSEKKIRELYLDLLLEV